MLDPICLALIDDDESVLDALQQYFVRRGFRATGFCNAESFLAAVDRGDPFDCVVTDMRMPDMSGLELLDALNRRSFVQPFIVITGHGDVDMAVAAIKNGAFDFIEKPFDEARLLKSIRQAVETARQAESEGFELKDLQSRINALSARQRQVMELVASGMSSKEIANQLSISQKTVENHRAWVMERMGARNVAEMVRMVTKIRMRK
jgi:two-component system response regulator FixJ